MRTFKIIAGERARQEDGTPLVEFILSDIDKGVAIRCDLPYGEMTGHTRDEAYAMLKDIAGASIRQRVANDIVPPVKDCPNQCTRGYLYDGPGSVKPCDHPPCHDYADAVNRIGEVEDINVIYRPGSHWDGGFAL